ncbi:hypothetical protein MMC17_003964 [Xylographa soralifera]|nr:hypothetical protein [Xylographa soralifera]
MASHLTIDQQLQLLNLADPLPGWNMFLPAGETIQTTFYTVDVGGSPAPSAKGSASGSSSSKDSAGSRRFDGMPKLDLRPPQGNVIAAAFEMDQFLSQHWSAGKVAVAGGVAVRLHGGPRHTYDVDIAITENIGSLIPILLQHPKLILPHARIFTGALRMYMRTGPAYNHVNCPSDQLVKVELLMEGLRPVRFTEHITIKGFRHHELSGNIHVMDFQCLLRSKLHAFSEREGEHDYQDVLFLISNHQEETLSFIARLDADWRETFIAKGIMKRNPTHQNVELFMRLLKVTSLSTPSPSLSASRRSELKVTDPRLGTIANPRVESIEPQSHGFS